MSFKEKLKRVKLVILDVDGVLTNGIIYYGNFGDEIKAFDVKDGLGIALLKKAGVEVVLLTAKKSKVARLRSKDVGINISNVYVGVSKLKIFKRILRKFRVGVDEVCYVGDDLLDLPVMKKVGLPIAVANAVDEIKASALYTTEKQGGNGAVREVCELILKTQNKWSSLIKQMIDE